MLNIFYLTLPSQQWTTTSPRGQQQIKNFPWRRWGSSLPGLRTLDPSLSLPSTPAQIFGHTCLSLNLSLSGYFSPRILNGVLTYKRNKIWGINKLWGPTLPADTCGKTNSACIDGGLSRVLRVRIHWSEDPHQRQRNLKKWFIMSI